MAWWNGLPDVERARWVACAGTGVAADSWALYKSMLSRIERPDLKAAVEAVVPTPKHAGLLKKIRAVEGFEDAKLARIEDQGSYLSKRKVVSAAGEVIHTDHEEWLETELAADGGDARATRRRLAALDHQLTKCSVVGLRIIVDRGGDQTNFVQVDVDHLTEVVDCRLFEPDDGWRDPRDLRELVDNAEYGRVVAKGDRRLIGVQRYDLVKVVDLAAFVKATQVVHAERTKRQSDRQIRVSHGDGTVRVMTGAQLDPDLHRYPCREQRFFDDWTASSAGRSGARACEHWTFKTADWTDPKAGERHLSFVPEWTTTRKLAKLERRPPSDYALFGKLEALDQRVGVPFGWYFFMLHGNRVQDWAGEAILASAEAGRIVLPEHDYQVLRNWRVRGYGF